MQRDIHCDYRFRAPSRLPHPRVLLALAALLAISLLLGACGDDDDGNGGITRDEIEQDYQDRVDDLQREADELRDALADAEGEARNEVEDGLDALERDLQDARGALDDLRAETDERFDDARNELDAAIDAIGDALGDLRDRVEDVTG